MDLQLTGAALSQADICIIHSDADCVVFSVRVPMKTIRDNHHFLLAVSETISSGSHPIREQGNDA
jgi:hypothetical protein